MKIAIIGDTQFGISPQTPIIQAKLMEFLDKVFFPTIDERKVEMVVHLGDLFEERKELDVKVQQEVELHWTKPLLARKKLKVVHIIGNHCCYFNNTARVNSPSLVYKGGDPGKFEIVEDVLRMNNKLTFVGWGVDIQKAEGSKYLFGHFDIVGFEITRGIINTKSGYKPSDFRIYDLVWSGHYHRQSHRDNIIYVGSPMALDFSETGIDHGFYIFDDETGEYEFIKNPIHVFKTIIYNDDQDMDAALEDADDYRDKIVKLVGTKVRDEMKFSKYIEKVKQLGVVEVRTSSIEVEPAKVIGEMVVDGGNESTLSLIKAYIDAMTVDSGINKEKLFDILHRFHDLAKIEEAV